MRALGEVFNLFICVILTRYNAVTAVIYVENGKSETLNPNIQGKPEDILWTFNGNKVAEHDLTEFQEYGQFIGRSGIELTTGKLTVRHMTSQDSGIYRSAIQIDGKLQNSENEVQVIDAVQEPNVTCKLNSITKSKTLFCSVSSEFQTSFEWTGSNSVQHSGQELHISKEEKPDSVFTCTVKNEVSQKSTSFTLKDCPTDIPQPEENIILPVILAIVAVIIVVITVAVAIYFICQRKNTDSRRSRVKNEDGIQHSLINISGLSGEDNQALRKMKNNEEQDINEDGEESDNNEEAERMDYVNQALKNNQDAENNEEQDINEDGNETEKNEEAERMDGNEFDKDLYSYEENEQEISEAQDLTGPAEDTSNE